MLEAARSYARATNQRVEFVFASVGAIQKRIAMGERADVVVASAAGVAALVALGVAQADSHAMFAQTILALAARPGVTLPNVADEDALRRAFESVAALGVPDSRRGAPGASQANELLHTMGLSGDARSRIRWLGSGTEAVKLLQSGGIDLALLWMSDVAGVPGIEVSGPVVAVSTQGAAYAAAVPRSATVPQSGISFIAHLRSAEVAGILKRAGYRVAD